jgi:4-amino-4-deoxychorismate lyase
LVDRVVAVLGVGVVPPDTAILRADDLGAMRGDGIFETLHVRDGRPWLLDEHLFRMAGSAARLDLPLPSSAQLARLAEQACAAWRAQADAAEGALRLICTRGPEDGGPVTAYATIAPIGAALLRARRDGIAVLTASLGVAARDRPAAPWLLGGAKSLSYAVNMASLRWAAARGADDVLWVSTDGYALEAPTASLVWLVDGAVCTIPPQPTGILAGITAQYLLDHAAELGWRAEHRMVRPTELLQAQAVWFTSSVRGVAEVRSIDDHPTGPSPETTTRVRKLLGYPPG